MKTYNIVEDTKKEIVNNILDSTAFKFTKYAALGLGAIYTLGFVFKVLAFTKTNFNQLKRAIKA